MSHKEPPEQTPSDAKTSSSAAETFYERPSGTTIGPKTPALDSFPHRSTRMRWLLNYSFMSLCIVIAALSVVILSAMLIFIGVTGRHALLNLPESFSFSGLSNLINTTFLTSLPSDNPEEAGIGPALLGTVWVCTFCAIFTLPLGVATAILLEEYRPKGRVARAIHSLIQLNISNLAGVPSVVYGIIGLTSFVLLFNLVESSDQAFIEFGAKHFDQFRTVYRTPEGRAYVLQVPVDSANAEETELRTGMSATDPEGNSVEIEVLASGDPMPTDDEVRKRTVRATESPGRFSKTSFYYFRLPFGRGVLAGSLTLMLVILPVVIIASQEALRAVPSSLREGALGLGATRWQVVRIVTLPSAIPGIMTGSILAMSRAIGEAAPILIVAGSVYVSFYPSSLMDQFTVMPLQVYAWAKEPQQQYHELAAGGIIVLLLILLTFNAIAVFIRHITSKPLS